MSNISCGTAGGTPISVDTTKFTAFSSISKVLLSADYVRIVPGSGMPSPPDFTGCGERSEAGTILSGKTLTLHKGEADALIAAGKATAA